MTEHKHQFAPIVAGYTAPGEKALSWKACGICGQEDPKDPRPDEAVDKRPEEDS